MLSVKKEGELSTHFPIHTCALPTIPAAQYKSSLKVQLNTKPKMLYVVACQSLDVAAILVFNFLVIYSLRFT